MLGTLPYHKNAIFKNGHLGRQEQLVTFGPPEPLPLLDPPVFWFVWVYFQLDARCQELCDTINEAIGELENLSDCYTLPDWTKGYDGAIDDMARSLSASHWWVIWHRIAARMVKKFSRKHLRVFHSVKNDLCRWWKTFEKPLFISVVYNTRKQGFSQMGFVPILLWNHVRWFLFLKADGFSVLDDI
jgi:hypothetical protein